MEWPGQVRVAQVLGPVVGVAHYGTVHHPLQSYTGTLTAIDTPQQDGLVPLTTTTTIAHCLPHTLQSASTLPCGVTVAPLVTSYPKVQYYYGAAQPLHHTTTTTTITLLHTTTSTTLPHTTTATLPHTTTTITTLGLQPPHAATPEPRPQPTLLEVSQETRLYPGKTHSSRGNSARLSRKKCRNSGQAYVSSVGKAVPAKSYQEQDCECRHQCLSKLGTTADRAAIFRRFWDMGDFEKQNAHLAQSVVLISSGKARQSHHRTVRRMYYVKLKENQTRVRVCKSQFLRLHGVSNGRLDRVLQALHCACPNALQDRRGHHIPSNKTAPEDVHWAARHFQELQQQQRVTATEERDNHKKSLSVKGMYELYQKWCEAQGRTSVSLWVYRQVGRAVLAPQKGKEWHGTAEGMDSGAEEKVLVWRGVDIQRTTVPVSTTTTTTIAATTTATPNSNPADTTHMECSRAITTSYSATSSLNVTYYSASPTTTTTTTTTAALLIITTTTTALPTITTTPAPLPTPTTTIAPLPSTTTTTTTTPTTNQTRSKRRQRRPREGVRRSSPMSRAERKTRRNKGESYITSSGKICSQKVYQDRPCGCRHRCIPALGTPQARRQVFESFWGLASFTRQNAYIARMVTLAPLSQRRTTTAGVRTYARVYRVQFKTGGEILRVCKVAFLSLHGISNGRLDRVLQALAGQSPCALKDLRGRHVPKNKTQEEDARHALSHICTFPLRHTGPNKHSQLLQSLSVEKMYRMYCEQCVSEGRKPVGNFVYRKIWKERCGHVREGQPGSDKVTRSASYQQH